MQIGAIQLDYRFGGAAGDYQDAGHTLALIAELGDNYGLYHQQLAEAIAAIGSRPDPADYVGDFTGYQRANSQLGGLLAAERVLRVSTLIRAGDRDRQKGYQIPLVDENERLIDMRSPRSQAAPAPAKAPALKSQPGAPWPVPTPRGS